MGGSARFGEDGMGLGRERRSVSGPGKWACKTGSGISQDLDGGLGRPEDADPLLGVVGNGGGSACVAKPRRAARLYGATFPITLSNGSASSGRPKPPKPVQVLAYPRTSLTGPFPRP